ncbi:IS66 family transposase, partial [Candidatus Peregrinibacteria bacterium CG10_big_fil_rev_8_21_14_0_10_44_7]
MNKYEAEFARHREELTHKNAQIERLEEIVRLLKHHRFGRKSEAVKSNDQQLPLGIFNEAETETVKVTEEPPSVTVKSYRRRGTPKRIKLPADLPREDVIVDLAEEEKHCTEGHELKLIGEDVSEQLDVVPAQIKVIRTIRKKYACPTCGDCVKRAPLPKTAIPKSMAGPGLLAYIATSKYGDGLPLYRQEHMWQRAGIDIPRATMAAWMIKVGDLLTPLINLMEEELLESGYVQADETRVQVLKESGKLAESLSYMWVRSRAWPGVKPITIFEYDPTRSGDVAKRLFVEYQGYLQADGYEGYSAICSKAGIIRCGCMAHCRRKFFEAAKASAKGIGLANEAIEMIRKLYEIEKTIKDKKIDERHRIRLAGSKPLLDELRKWLDDNLGKVPPQSQLGKALHYAHNEWPYLIRYIDDGRLSIDNNTVENAIRPFVVGRKNWLFSDSVAGASSSAAIYSLMVSAKQNGHNEYAYFRYVLEKLPHAEKVEDFEALLPH